MPDLDMMGGGMPQKPDNHEAAMARADLYKSANYSFKLFKMIQDGQELEGWVQAKITKAADYIASVYHYMEYEMKFNEYGKKLEDSDVYTESVKQQFVQKLTEARVKMEKLKEKNIADLEEDSWAAMKQAQKDRSGPQPSGGSGVKQGTRYGGGRQKDEKEPAEKRKATKEEVDKSKIPAAHRRAKGGDWKVSLADLAKEKAKNKSSTSGLKAEKERLGMKEALKGGQKNLDVDKDGKLEKSDFAKLRAGKDVKEAAKPDFLDMDKDGNKKEPMKKAVANKEKNPFAKKDESIVAEKAVSKAQQKFMGMVHAAKKGKKPASKAVATAAKGMSAKSAKDYASTKHKGLPAKKVDESYPKNQDLSGISTDKLKSYLDKQSKQQVSGEGAQVKRVKAELAKRNG